MPELRVCHTCGEVYAVDQVGHVTTVLPRYCPFCGGTTTAATRSIYPFNQAHCFTKFPEEILRTLWLNWPEHKTEHATFLQYAYATIRKYLATAQETAK